jgi:hypothetical protein
MQKIKYKRGKVGEMLVKGYKISVRKDKFNTSAVIDFECYHFKKDKCVR